METEFSINSRPSDNVMTAALLLFIGAIAPTGFVNNFFEIDFSPTLILVICWAAAGIFLIKKRTMSACLSPDRQAVYINVDQRQWSYNIESIDRIAIHNRDPNDFVYLEIVLKNQKRDRILASPPVDAFGRRLVQLMNVRWSSE